MPSMVPLLPKESHKDMKIQSRNKQMKACWKETEHWEMTKPVTTTSCNMYPFIKL